MPCGCNQQGTYGPQAQGLGAASNGKGLRGGPSQPNYFASPHPSAVPVKLPDAK